MPKVVSMIFKELTNTDFARINASGYVSGGGQAYIDFRKAIIPIADWDAFFQGVAVRSMRTNGPAWTFPVRNLGTNTVQNEIVVYQRRSSSISIGSQKLPSNSGSGKRLQAWTPELTGFPASPGVISSASDVPHGLLAGLRVFLIRDIDDVIWAGWTRSKASDFGNSEFDELFDNDEGYLKVKGDWALDPTRPYWPFSIASNVAQGTSGDEPFDPLWDSSDVLHTEELGISYSLQTVRKRNKAAASLVRKLYTECQISGDEFLFTTKSGKPYLEVHHLIPLGKGGADLPYNMVVVSPHVHKMLHYANVSEIAFSKIADNNMVITINDQPYTIAWHPKHAETILKAVSEQ